MRGKITDQDLTNYALNDGMDPAERLYVESMLAVSEECRQDIYGNLEMAQMLETGFERLYGEAAPMLTEEQRAILLCPPRRRFAMATVHRAAVVLGMAACAAFALANPNLWQMEGHRNSLAHVSQMVANTMSGEFDSGLAAAVSMPTLSEDVDALLQTVGDAMPQTNICTPPTLNTADFIDFR